MFEKSKQNQLVVLVFDIDFGNDDEGTLFHNNHINLPGLSLYPVLHDLCLNYNIICVTKRQFLINKNIYKFNILLGFSYEGKKKNISFFLQNGIVPYIVFTGEAPLSAKLFYKSINKTVDNFRYYFGFKGSFNLLSNINKKKFKDFYWPNTEIYQSGLNWKNRRLITFISSAKFKMPANFNNIFSRNLRYLRYFTNNLISLFEKKYDFGEDLIPFRLMAIVYFSKYKNFQLFGKGWEFVKKYDKFLSNIQFYHQPLPLTHKSPEISKSRFTLCFENSNYSGYITEKVFDIMLSGSVPIWKGCKEIYDYIPSNCFIDISNFATFDDLYLFLNNMDEALWNSYIKNIYNYLNSDNYRIFTADYFSSEVITLIKNDYTIQE
jgi:hypothetical protein